MEETETSKTKVSDSAYSNSSTSHYQRSNGSSKSRHSNSSGSSGYCGRPSVVSSGNDEAFPQPPQMCAKRKDKKRKPLKKAECLSSSSSWNQENCRVGIEVIGGGTVSGVTSSVNVVNGTPTIGPNTGMNGIGVAVSSIGTEVTPIIVNNSVTETQNGGDSDVLQMAALTQTLNCIKKINGKDSTLKCIQGGNGIQRATSGPLDSRVKEHIANCFKGDTYGTQAEGEGFVVVVSMADGSVVHTTRNLVAALGFPCDMWLGRDFIDFVHPKDRMAFAGHITSGVAKGEDTSFKGLSNKTSFYCSLRQYRGLRNVGYGVTGKRVPYLPFHLSLTFREMNFSLADSQMANSPISSSSPHSSSFQNIQAGVKDAGIKDLGELNGNVFLVITATRIYSAYKEPDEELFPSTARNSPPPYSPAPAHSQPVKPNLSNPHEPVNPIVPRKFVTRHLSSCCLSHVDPSAVPYLGYLPQDMETRSVMDFYHPEDMPILKEAYQNVMSQQSSPFRGKPYRYKTQNGTYALIETEWSGFVNPWSRKLEFVIGQHHVLKGPRNPDVFTEPTEDICPQFSEDVIKESDRIQEEIMFMLDQKVTRVSESARQQVSKRCRDLASFMETLMDEMAKPADLLRVELPAQDEHSFSERDSVMLGEISPHHDYSDGKSSTETPPSYNQLNYNENLQRFFESKPKTTLSDESSEMKMEGSSSNNRSQNLSTDEEGKSSPIVMDSSSGSGEGRKCCSQANESESGGSGSRARTEGKGGGNSSHEEQVDSGGGEGGEGTTTFKGNRGTGASEPINKSRHLSGYDKARTSKHHSGDAYHSPHLTEALLSRHNEDMEKIMVQKHREQRSLDREGKLKDGRKSNHDKSQDLMISHGVKRSGSHSWEGEPQRVKHQHIELPQQHGSQGVVGPWEQLVVNAPIIVPAPTAAMGAGNILAPVITNAPTATLKSDKQVQLGLTTPTASPPLQSFNLWSPFSVMMAPMHNSQPCLMNSCPGMAHQQQRLPTLPSSALPPTLQPPPPMADPSLHPPHSHQFPLPLQHPFPHSLNPHPQGLVPVYYVPTAAVGAISPSVDVENTSTHSHLMGFPQQQVRQPQVPGYTYIVPPPHSQPTGLSSAAGTILIPNHMQYLSTIPQMVYQSVGSAQVNGPGSPHMLFPSLNNFVPVPSPYPPQLSASATADMSSPLPPIPPRQQTSAPNSHYLHMRHSSKNHHHHQSHHVRLLQPQSSSVKGLTRQGSLLRGRDGLGVFLMAGRESVSTTTNLNKVGMQQDEERDENGDDHHLLFSKCQRPSSQATSVKVEPGSAVGSITSVSALRELSEVFKKSKSVGSFGLSKPHAPRDEEDYRRKSREGERKCSECTIEDGGKGRDSHTFRLLHDQDTLCDDSSYSSLYSFLRTEKSDDSMRSFPWDWRTEVLENDAKDDMKAMGSNNIGKGEVGEKHVQKPLRKGPSWLEEVDITPDLVFRYKMDDQILHNVLEADLKTLNNIHQSSTVNEQLSQLYMDMELEGATTRLSLEDSTGFTSSSGTDEASTPFGVFNMRSSPATEKAGELHKSKKKRRTMEYEKLVMIFEENAPFPPPPTLSTYSQ